MENKNPTISLQYLAQWYYGRAPDIIMGGIHEY
jgi:hypothetical protein